MIHAPLVLAGAAVYIIALLAIGILASRNVSSSTEFVVAGRRLPLSLCTFTLFATWFGAGTCIGAAGAAYRGGIQGVIADPFGAGLCLFLAGLFYVRVLRRMRLLTVPDFFRRRFGRPAELLASICMLPAYVGWVGAQFVAFGIILHQLTGVDSLWATVIGAVVVLAYTIAGGMWAVTLTDFIQGVVLIVGLLLLVPFVVEDMGGFGRFVERSPEGSFSLLPEPGLKEWLWYLQAWLVIGIGNLPGQDLIQRALGAKNEWVAQWSAYFAGALYFTVGMIPVLLGMMGALLVPDIADPEHILLRLGLDYLDPVVLAVFVGALFSALMSSADSGLLAPASIFGQNILKNLRPRISQGELLAAIRWAVLGTGLTALATALYFQQVYDLMVNSWSIMLVSLFVPMTAGLYWKRANSPGAVASLTVGTVAWIGLAWYQSEYPADLMAAALALMVLVAVSLLTRSAPRPLTDIDGEPIDPRNRLGLLVTSAGATPRAPTR